MASGLEVPELEVWLEGGNKPIRVRATQAVQVKWDLERAKRRWPEMGQAQALWSTFVSWAAAVKQGAIEADMPFDVFADRIVKVDLIGSTEADPTPSGPEPD